MVVDESYCLIDDDEAVVKGRQLHNEEEQSCSLSLDDVTINTLTGHLSAVTCCCFSNDQKYVATGSHDNDLKIWTLDTRELVATLGGHTTTVKCVAFNLDATLVASGSGRGYVIVWACPSGERLNFFPDHHTSSVECIAFHPSSNLICTGSWDCTLAFWEIRRSLSPTTLVKVISDHQSALQSCVFSNDGTFMASGSWDYTVCVYLISGEESEHFCIKMLHRLVSHTSNVKYLAFSSTGVLASASWDCTVRLWNPRSGECLSTLRKHEGYVHVCAFTPDGCYLASACDDNVVYLWEVKTGVLMRTLKSFSDEIFHLSFQGTNRLVTSGPVNQLSLFT